MKISEKVIPIFKKRLTPNKRLLNKLNDDDLERADVLAHEIELELKNISDLTGEENTTGISLNRIITSNINNPLFENNIINSIENIVCAVNIANIIDTTTWEKEPIYEFDDFKITELDSFDEIMSTNGERLRIYCHQNQKSIKDSFALLDLRGVTSCVDLEYFLSPNIQAQKSEIITTLCKKILEEKNSLLDKCIVLSRTKENKKKKSLIRYILIADQKTTIKQHKSENKPPVQDIVEKLKITADLQQYLETISMLGEINCKNTVIDIFMSTYHVLENYMMRARIALISENTNHPGYFTTRDLRRLEISLDDKENKHLISLFKDCLNITIGDSDFQGFMVNQLATLRTSPGFSEDDFDKMLVRLGVTKPNMKIAEIPTNQFYPQYAANIIYKLRCAIVHNKETEFHLSNKELANLTYKAVLTDYAIPIMQRLAYGLPTVEEGNPTIYKHRTIELYRTA